MITGIIAGFILLAVLPPAIDNGEYGVIAVAVVIAGFLLLLGHESRNQDRAYNNWVSYWARGGPEREKRKVRTVSQTGKVRDRSTASVSELFICPTCRRQVFAKSTYGTFNGKLMKSYYCPYCKASVWTGVEKR